MSAADTTFGWDDSHYGAPPAAKDGIELYTHKLTDGDHYYEDAEYQAAMTAARRLGMSILGPYHVLHGQRSIENQALWLVERATKLTPWWQDWPDWTWQIDSEPFGYLTKPTIAEVNAFGRDIMRLTGCPRNSVLGYCPKWAYGDELLELEFPWWQSNYGGNPAGPYRSIYPGNDSSRWAGPILAALLQYGSQAIIAGQYTCDANAFRGTLAELKAFLKGGSDMATDAEIQKLIMATNERVEALALGKSVIKTPWASDPNGLESQWTVTTLKDLLKRITALETTAAKCADCANCAGGDGDPSGTYQITKLTPGT